MTPESLPVVGQRVFGQTQRRRTAEAEKIAPREPCQIRLVMAGEKGAVCARVKFVRRLPRAPPRPLPAGSIATRARVAKREI